MLLYFCQNKAFHFVDKKDIIAGKNPGNFLALLKDFAQNDKVLFDRLYNPRAKNVTHLSPTTQNERINIIGYDFILDGIISAVIFLNYSR